MRGRSGTLISAAIAHAWVGAAVAQAFKEEELAMACGDKATVGIATGAQQSLPNDLPRPGRSFYVQATYLL